MTAGELPDREARRELDRRENVGANPAAFGKLRLQHRVAFAQPFSEVIGDHFEAGAKTSDAEGNVRLKKHLTSRSAYKVALGLPMISLTPWSSGSGSMGRRNGRSYSKLIASISIVEARRNAGLP